MSEPSWKVRVLGRADADRCDVVVRGQRYELGPAVTFDPACSAVSALEALLGALGADLVSGFARAARRRRLAVEDLEAVVGGRLRNALASLAVIGEPGDPGLAELSVRLYVATHHGEEEVARAWAEALDASPLAATLGRALRIELSFKIIS